MNKKMRDSIASLNSGDVGLISLYLVDIKNNGGKHKKALKRIQDIFWIATKKKKIQIFPKIY